MARKRRKRVPPGAQCVYCAVPLVEDTYTRDHVPPTGLFPTVDRGDLPWVPACKACNGRFSLDDEYARHIFTMAAGADDSAHVREARARDFRAMQRPQHVKLLNQTLGSFSRPPTWRRGIYVGRPPVLEFDRPRLCRFISRIVCGLFYLRFERILPLDYTPVAEMLQDDPLFYSIPKRASLERLHRVARARGEYMVADGAFEYALITDEDWGIDNADPNYSSWALRFYGALNFVAFTPERELVDDHRAPFALDRGPRKAVSAGG